MLNIQHIMLIFQHKSRAVPFSHRTAVTSPSRDVPEAIRPVTNAGVATARPNQMRHLGVTPAVNVGDFK